MSAALRAAAPVFPDFRTWEVEQKRASAAFMAIAHLKRVPAYEKQECKMLLLEEILEKGFNITEEIKKVREYSAIEKNKATLDDLCSYDPEVNEFKAMLLEEVRASGYACNDADGMSVLQDKLLSHTLSGIGMLLDLASKVKADGHALGPRPALPVSDNAVAPTYFYETPVLS